MAKKRSASEQKGLLMASDLKPPLSTYFAASNAHDADSVAALFADDALVHDENADHRGRTAIRAWAQGTYDQYRVRLTPRDAVADGEAIVVTTGVSGTFPGSPIELQLRFVVDGDRIDELRIG
jgi:ketosteroid isomerase-like protein